MINNKQLLNDLLDSPMITTTSSVPSESSDDIFTDLMKDHSSAKPVYGHQGILCNLFKYSKRKQIPKGEENSDKSQTSQEKKPDSSRDQQDLEEGVDMYTDPYVQGYHQTGSRIPSSYYQVYEN